MALEDITPATRLEEFIDRVARAAASPNLPEVDASDNGDVLTVVSGEWAAAAPPSGLPEVTSSNNGQVLMVVSGEWAAAEQAGGSPLIVHLSPDPNDSETLVMDKTAGEIINAMPNTYVYMEAEIDPPETDKQIGYVHITSYINGSGNIPSIYAGYNFMIKEDPSAPSAMVFVAATLADYPVETK